MARAKREIQVALDNFKGGLHTLVNANKIKPNELSVATNIVLVDEGSPRPRWGTNTYGEDSSGTIVTLLETYTTTSGTEELIKIEDGIGKKYNQSNGTWSNIAGASFTSTALATATTLNNVLYIVNGVDDLTKYDGSTFTRFTALSAPSNVSVARGASLTSGNSDLSYIVTAITEVGETDGSTAGTVRVDKERDQWNFDPNSPDSNYSVTITWDKVTGARGYNIYGVESGFETYLGRVSGEDATEYVDFGLVSPSALYEAPTANTTTGPKGKYIQTFKSALLIAGDTDRPSRLYFSAGVDRPDSFALGDGGGFVDVSATDSSGDIRGLGLYQGSAIVLKENSVWQFNFTGDGIPAVGNITRSQGCVSHRSIQQIENDLFFMGKKPGKGYSIYVLGNEPNFTTIRTNELSARVRPDLENINPDREEWIEAEYFDGKYIASFADGSSEINNQAIVYDRERLAFTKWQDINMEHMKLFTDEDGQEQKLFIDGSDYRVAVLDENLTNDRGNAISWEWRSKDDDGKKPFLYKRARWADYRLRNADGTVNFNLFIDGVRTTKALTLSTGVNATTLRKGRLRQARLRISSNQNIDIKDEVIARRFPYHRLGRNAVGRSIGYGISSNNLNAKATTLNLSYTMRERSSKFIPLSEVNQI
jgi:hypothetical protein